MGPWAHGTRHVAHGTWHMARGTWHVNYKAKSVVTIGVDKIKYSLILSRPITLPVSRFSRPHRMGLGLSWWMLLMFMVGMNFRLSGKPVHMALRPSRWHCTSLPRRPAIPTNTCIKTKPSEWIRAKVLTTLTMQQITRTTKCTPCPPLWARRISSCLVGRGWCDHGVN